MVEVDVNRASVSELEGACHSRERAQEILNRRELLGDYKDWDDFCKKLQGRTERLARALQSAGFTLGARQG